MHTGSVTNFFAKEAEKNLQNKIAFLACALLFVVCLAFIFVVSIPKSHLNYAVRGHKVVLPFSKTPPTIQTQKAITPQQQLLLLKKSEISKAKLYKLKKIYKTLSAKKIKEKNTLKKLEHLRKSISRQQKRINKFDTLISQK